MKVRLLPSAPCASQQGDKGICSSLKETFANTIARLEFILTFFPLHHPRNSAWLGSGNKLMCLFANCTAQMAASLPRGFLPIAPVLETTCRTRRAAKTFFARAGMVSFSDPRGSSSFCNKKVDMVAVHKHKP